MERISQITGKPIPEHIFWGEHDCAPCEYCGYTKEIYECSVCGAPVCCPVCCFEATQEELKNLTPQP